MHQFIVIATAFLAFIIVAFLISKRKFRQLKKSRKGWSFDEIVSHFEEMGFQKEIVQILLKELEFYTPDLFLMHPEDHLVKDYEIDEEDLSELVESLFVKARGRKMLEEDYIEANKNGGNVLSILGMLKCVFPSNNRLAE